ncbi:uncharacterized protein LOC129592975 [Paramacrobiotus metropolitanus]|uniref:uncharacterized protein LOC129592975 n=1 Tax=Paramacrobiotus metropolitanus TaxID=2943436 RepID=UPI0024458AB1|nr:uncharacterized protein LOC129592975 [Paramacrobiotus metropolitanus]
MMRVAMRSDHGRTVAVNGRWQRIAHFPQLIQISIPCETVADCRNVRESIQADREAFAARLTLSFRFQTPQNREIAFCSHQHHFHHSSVFHSIVEQKAAYEYVFLPEMDYQELIQEIVQSAIEDTLQTGEFVDDAELELAKKQMAALLRYNTTSSAEFTENMWNATYWRGADRRPDEQYKYLTASLGSRTQHKTRSAKSSTLSIQLDEKVAHLAGPLAELDEGRSGVEWNGREIFIRPRTMYCLNLKKLHEEVTLAHNISVHISRHDADYTASVRVGSGVSQLLLRAHSIYAVTTTTAATTTTPIAATTTTATTTIPTTTRATTTTAPCPIQQPWLNLGNIPKSKNGKFGFSYYRSKSNLRNEVSPFRNKKTERIKR